jgi:diguanylate cyclase (GGDEF)-like protein
MTPSAESRTGESASAHLVPQPPDGARMQLWSVVVAGGAATFATLLVLSGQAWMLPLAAALLYLTYRSYSIYRDQLAADQRHHEEVTRLHREAVAALEAAQLSEQRYARAARHDDLTGLPNRRLFSELLQRSMARGARAAEPHYAVLFIDLDGFKLVNDSLGHVAGDEFLVAISERLLSHLRPSDVLARLGGDEFAVLIEDFTSPDEVCVVTERLQRSLNDPLRLQGRELYASASIGVVLGGPQYQGVDDLLRDADIAMYRAKAAGRGGYQIFDPHMHASAVERLMLETELRHAVERHEFTIAYQPIVELPSSEICGLEAFVRWTRTDGTLIGPAEFIPVAEETGLIVPLTYSVLGDACGQAAAWQRMFGQPLGMSVNISSRMFARPDFVDEVEKAIEVSGLLAGTLRLEITETTLLNPSELVQRNFERLRQLSVAMYLDDFGTGYSSLSSLQRYPVDALKLDRSFVARMGAPDHGCAIGNAIVKLAQELGMGLIAERVETLAHAEQLMALGCPHAQGHLFSEPQSTIATEALLARAFDKVPAATDRQSLRSRTRRTA